LPSLSSLQASMQARYLSGRRGSAPGCIGFYSSCELAAAAIVLLHAQQNAGGSTGLSGNGASAVTKITSGAISPQFYRKSGKRRSSLPLDELSGPKLMHKMKLGPNGSPLQSIKLQSTGSKSNATSGASTGSHHLEFGGKSIEALKKLIPSRQAFSLDSQVECNKQFRMSSKPRRGSVPQEVLIESLSNYCAHEHL
jgi:hypothetical protein